MKPASLLAAILLDIIAVVHLLRLVFHTEVIIGGWVLPMWVSLDKRFHRRNPTGQPSWGGPQARDNLLTA